MSERTPARPSLGAVGDLLPFLEEMGVSTKGGPVQFNGIEVEVKVVYAETPATACPHDPVSFSLCVRLPPEVHTPDGSSHALLCSSSFLAPN